MRSGSLDQLDSPMASKNGFGEENRNQEEQNVRPGEGSFRIIEIRKPYKRHEKRAHGKMGKWEVGKISPVGFATEALNTAQEEFFHVICHKLRNKKIEKMGKLAHFPNLNISVHDRMLG